MLKEEEKGVERVCVGKRKRKVRERCVLKREKGRWEG